MTAMMQLPLCGTRSGVRSQVAPSDVTRAQAGGRWLAGQHHGGGDVVWAPMQRPQLINWRAAVLSADPTDNQARVWQPQTWAWVKVHFSQKLTRSKTRYIATTLLLNGPQQTWQTKKEKINVVSLDDAVHNVYRIWNKVR